MYMKLIGKVIILFLEFEKKIKKFFFILKILKI